MGGCYSYRAAGGIQVSEKGGGGGRVIVNYSHAYMWCFYLFAGNFDYIHFQNIFTNIST